MVDDLQNRLPKFHSPFIVGTTKSTSVGIVPALNCSGNSGMVKYLLKLSAISLFWFDQTLPLFYNFFNPTWLGHIENSSNGPRLRKPQRIVSFIAKEFCGLPDL